MAIIGGKNIKEFVGRVVSDKMDKSIVVEVETAKVHPLYRKRYISKKKYHAHDQNNEATKGSLVKIRESRPISKLKRWQLVEVVEKQEI
ncbi:30S ribosomal protein S17 [Candidatus Absconditicoccus praedator]|uniref:30S ribosomal protein S17 n=1 Tax=Candidatus Absconditicoccus praedator TaxID=2735562 RepID=UPI001E461B66|nr:30S ribosomal protein S17 [Candidatus Absconditicoccus praedator]UFX82780.1 30S ribosomal protein S17 [Candidatus Absconditicoccus praedator]